MVVYICLLAWWMNARKCLTIHSTTCAGVVFSILLGRQHTHTNNYYSIKTQMVASITLFRCIPFFHISLPFILEEMLTHCRELASRIPKCYSFKMWPHTMHVNRSVTYCIISKFEWAIKFGKWKSSLPVVVAAVGSIVNFRCGCVAVRYGLTKANWCPLLSK